MAGFLGIYFSALEIVPIDRFSVSQCQLTGDTLLRDCRIRWCVCVCVYVCEWCACTFRRAKNRLHNFLIQALPAGTLLRSVLFAIALRLSVQTEFALRHLYS